MALEELKTDLRRLLHPKSCEQLDRLAALPEVQELLGRDEAEMLRAREKLAKRHVDGPSAEQLRAVAAAAREHAASTARCDRLVAELAAARDDERDKAAKHVALDVGIGRERADIEAELLEGADQRIVRAAYNLGEWRSSGLRHCLAFDLAFNEVTGKRTLVFNKAELDLAIAVTDQARAKLEVAKRRALGSEAVSSLLREVCNDLAAPYRAIGILPPMVDEHGDLKLNMPDRPEVEAPTPRAAVTRQPMAAAEPFEPTTAPTERRADAKKRYALLVDQKENLRAEARALLNRVQSEDRDLSSDEQKQFDGLMAAVKKVNDQIKATGLAT